ncbi:IS5 family transposase [Vulcanimicrobium alpinum]|uniref:IS5 family transposase n=1 Tax=Vulcanimicrobium alpinum TaxID=3016050 RepID=UPI00295EA9A0|nr:IS5 family transposase [Vulcanimicrobium alpinum]
MRTHDEQRASVWTTLQPEDTVPGDHPLRPMRVMVNEILRELSPEFSKLYSRRGRPSIAPEKLLRALLLQMFYSIRSEPMLLEQLRYNLLFRWFVGLSMDDKIWDPSTFSKNRDRFLNGEISERFFAAVVERARADELLSNEHFTVDGTLIEAWASHKSFRPKSDDEPPTSSGGRNEGVNFRGRPRSNETHVSSTDPDARLYRKSSGAPAILGYLGHALMENRNGLIVGVKTTRATGIAEREAALELIRGVSGSNRITLGADKAYDTKDFVEALRALNVTPHVAQNTTRRRSAIDRRTVRHPGYTVSQRRRKLIEESFGWGKTIGRLRKVHFRGLDLVGDIVRWTAAAYNLIRIRNLRAAT